mmetsp:Transcript_47091/g.74340  ORF Transcript_47091/g.74340 Transcript_47091/m.74340 type:complete len:226 (-) Transcript_47091:34-711(-)
MGVLSSLREPGTRLQALASWPEAGTVPRIHRVMPLLVRTMDLLQQAHTHLQQRHHTRDPALALILRARLTHLLHILPLRPALVSIYLRHRFHLLEHRWRQLRLDFQEMQRLEALSCRSSCKHPIRLTTSLRHLHLTRRMRQEGQEDRRLKWQYQARPPSSRLFLMILMTKTCPRSSSQPTNSCREQPSYDGRDFFLSLLLGGILHVHALRQSSIDRGRRGNIRFK